MIEIKAVRRARSYRRCPVCRDTLAPNGSNTRVTIDAENAEAIARLARKRCGFTPDGRVMLVEHTYTIWALEGDMIIARPGSMRVSNRIPEDFTAWYTRPGEQLTEEDLG